MFLRRTVRHQRTGLGLRRLLSRAIERLEPTADVLLAVIIGVVLTHVLANGWAHLPIGCA